MAPTPQELPCLNPSDEHRNAASLSEISVVISGMSGSFPMSNSVEDFSHILYSKINPVNCEDLRWKHKHPEASEYIGKVPKLDRFDSQFFMVHKRLGDNMDPMARKILEHSYQAIYDAGLSPNHLKGKKVGVYIATAFSDTEKSGFIERPTKTGYGITGASKTMFANRVSYWLNSKGPSMMIDDACCGSTVALEEAFRSLNDGFIEAAIVGGTNVCLSPHSLVHYNRCIKISSDGKTRSFDQNADGCAKSESISVLLLQKARDAVRVYAEIVHVNILIILSHLGVDVDVIVLSECWLSDGQIIDDLPGYESFRTTNQMNKNDQCLIKLKNEFISRLSGENGQIFGFIRNPDTCAEFLKRLYSEAGVSPQDVKYIEACGTATPEADKAELQSIEKVFCENRSDPLLVGSVISNIGFTDAASGTTAITKVLLGYHHGLIASNLHYNTPRQDIPAIQDGRMSIVSDHQPFHGTYAAVNCLSLTGVNSHVLLRGYNKRKDLLRYQSSIPRLLTVSARQHEFIQKIFEILKSRSIDVEELALLQNIHSTNISGHLGRGYIILDTNEEQKTVSLSESAEYFDDTSRPLWFVYSGMGSQWAGMGAQLMRIPIFAAAIERCRKCLEPMGIDIVHIITTQDKSVFNNVLNSFVGIAAVQIGLTDILTTLGLRPDKIIGHSVGELGCAYADGCLSAEEMILSAYSRGKASNDTTLIRGAMAAVGLGYQQLSKICPPSIEIACHNSSSSSTISGPEEDVRSFVDTLTAKEIVAKTVSSANIAYHSSYIANAGPYLCELLSDVIKEPRARSKRWLSTSVPLERWGEPAAKYCSAEYLTNNLLSPVLFEETSSLIPSNAVLVEIAPHGLLQAILKRSLPNSCTNIPLTQRGHKDNALFLLNAVGNLYMKGFNPQVQAIYPKVKFPVSTGTPHLGHLVQWCHAESWSLVAGDYYTKSATTRSILVNIHDDDHNFLPGNVIQGKILYPFAGVLVAVWDTLAMALGLPKKKISVRFQDVHLYSQPILHEQKPLNLFVSLNRGNGQFEVLAGNSKVAIGSIIHILQSNLHGSQELSNKFKIGSEEIYKHFSSRGYSYSEAFQSIKSTDESVTAAQISWNGNWVTFIDGLLQLNVLRSTYTGVSQVTHIRDLTIDLDKHSTVAQQNPSRDESLLKAQVDEVHDFTRCGGVLLQNIKLSNLPSFNQAPFELVTTSPNVDNKNIAPAIKRSAKNNYVLQISNVGDLNTLHWEEGLAVDETGIKVQVVFAGINMADVNKAVGATPCKDSDKYFGMDFSGITKHGERVMGLVRTGAASTVVSARPDLLWPVPAHWTLEEAATVPLAYTQAFYYLCIRSKFQLRKSTKVEHTCKINVLIHGATGALGQAAISIALAHGYRVFATVSDNTKKKFLLKLFPELNEDDIGNSRDDTFGDMVLNATKGQGCDIVLSCVRNDLRHVSLKCAGPCGITVDLVNYKQNKQESKFGMFDLTYERTFISADFSYVLDLQNIKEIKKLQLLVCDGIARGYVRPLTHVTFAPHEAARAFRLLAASRHRGRALLRLRDPLGPVTPRIVCSSSSTHVIVWDGDSFGLQLADRLVARGARTIRLYCLKPNSKQHLLKLRLWKNDGIDVIIKTSSMDQWMDSNSVYAIMNEVAQQGSIEGLYVSFTGDTQDANVAKAAENLDTTSRKLKLPLKFFAVITVESNNGQQICFARTKENFPGVALSLPTYKKPNSNLYSLPVEWAWNRSAIDVAEIALRSKHPVLFAQTQTVEKPSFSKLIPCLADIDNDETSLQDLGLEEFLPSIQTFLRNVYHVSLDDDDVLMLTKNKLMEIEMNATEHMFVNVKGLSTFYSLDNYDELLATSDLVPMNTAVVNVDTTVGGIDARTPHLFIVPGLEGLHGRFQTLCELLKIPALVLQPGFDRPREAPQELAKRYSKIMLNQFKLTKNFFLIGYEFGVVVALEIAAILEKHGLIGTVYCIGDGPDELKALLESELSSFQSETALQEGMVRHMYKQLTRDSPASLERALQECSSWRQRVDACVRALLGRTSHTAQYIRAILEAAYARIDGARRTVVAPHALRSRLVVMRARHEHVREEACSLQRYTQRPLVIHHLAAPMAHAAYDLRVPALVNKYLDSDVLVSYEEMNLCNSYICLKLNN